MHLVGFIIRIYHDARSSECQISLSGVSTIRNLDLRICNNEGSNKYMAEQFNETRSHKDQYLWLGY